MRRAARANLAAQARFAYQRGQEEPTADAQLPTWERRTLASMPLMYRRSLDIPANEIRTKHGTGKLDVAMLRMALDAQPSTMLLTGDARIGKSVIAARVLMARCRARQVQGFWIGFKELVSEAREHGLGVTVPAVRRAREFRVVVLDDLGGEAPGTDVKLLINDIIERRFQRDLDTIVTTGLEHERIVELFGSGTAERLTEPGRSIVLAPRFIAL